MALSPKELVINKFQANRKRSLEFLSSLQSGEWEMYTLGTWHLHEVVAHLIGWSYESAIAMAELAANHPPSYDAYHQGDDWAEINAIFVRKYGSKDSVDLVEKLRFAGVFVCTIAESLPTEAFEMGNGVWRKGKQWTVYIELDDMANHEQKHIERVRGTLGLSGS